MRMQRRNSIAAVLVGVTLYAMSIFAKDHAWQDGTLTNITSEAPGMTAAGAETAFGYKIQRAYYWIAVGNMTYILVNSWNVGFHAPKAPLDLTINGKVKIAIEGKNAYLIDDSGHQIERPIITKISEPDPKAIVPPQ